MKKTLLTAFSLLALSATSLSAWSHGTTAGALKIGHPWARPTIKGMTMGGVFLTIQNTGAQADRLVSAQAEQMAQSAEIHDMVMKGDVMTMFQLKDGLAIEPGQTATLAPGRQHVMLMGLKRPLVVGDKFPLTLTFEKTGPVVVEVWVEKQASAHHGDAPKETSVHQHQH